VARYVYSHSEVRLWAYRHPWAVRVTIGLLSAVTAAGVALWVTSPSGPSGAEGHAGPGSAVESGKRVSGFSVLSTSPATGATDVSSDTLVVVRFSARVDASGPMPVFAPPVAGSWRRTDPQTLTFESAAPIPPGGTESLRVPGGLSGIRSSAGQRLAQSLSVTFEVGSSTLRLQQLLAELAYLPVSFTPTGPTPLPRETAEPQSGSFSWRWASSLSGLEDQWAPGDPGVITQGAVMTFENQHQLTVDGIAGPQVWTALLHAVQSGAADPSPYDDVYVSKTLPESLTVYVNGVTQFSNILVNTGISGVDTPDGTFEVFEHLTASDMKGTNLDGSTYDDPNVPWASYFYKGDALHGFVRSSYGYPQSNGCVEMSVANAGAIWPYTPIGTLVTVAGP